MMLDQSNAHAGPAPEPRELSTEELARFGEQSLVQRLHEQAILAHRRHGPLTMPALERMLSDPACVRYPTRMAFDLGDMALHQFAQPGIDPGSAGEGGGRVIYIHPRLRARPDLAVLAAAYVLPLLNYGENLIKDTHCLGYGSVLMGLSEDEFYERVCALADFVGAETQYPGGG